MEKKFIEKKAVVKKIKEENARNVSIVYFSGLKLLVSYTR